MDNLNVLVWNVRGLNDKNKRDNLRMVVDGCRPIMVCIQETKLASISIWDVSTLLDREFAEYTFHPAQGT
jgi:exonuclease III